MCKTLVCIQSAAELRGKIIEPDYLVGIVKPSSRSEVSVCNFISVLQLRVGVGMAMIAHTSELHETRTV